MWTACSLTSCTHLLLREATKESKSLAPPRQINLRLTGRELAFSSRTKFSSPFHQAVREEEMKGGNQNVLITTGQSSSSMIILPETWVSI